MAFREPATGKYWGFDAALAEDLARSLGVKLEHGHTRHNIHQTGQKTTLVKTEKAAAGLSPPIMFRSGQFFQLQEDIFQCLRRNPR